MRPTSKFFGMVFAQEIAGGEKLVKKSKNMA
jgi:hypothetical protein